MTGQESPSAATAAITGWVLPPTGTERSSSRSWSLVAAWVVAVAAVAALTLMRTADQAGSLGFRAGYAAGGLVMPFVVAAFARWVVVRFRRGRPEAQIGVLRSPWVPVGGIMLAVISGFPSLIGFAQSSPVDPSSALRIGPGFAIVEPEPSVARQVIEAFGEAGVVGEVAVREVVGDDGSLSMLVIVDSDLGPGHVFDLVRAMSDDSGVTPQMETVEGQRIAAAVGPDQAIAAWIETPLLLAIYAPDEQTMRAVLTSILETPRPG